MAELVSVRVRDCACPDQVHGDGDVVFLAPKLSLAGGLAADFDIRKAAGDGTFLAQLWQVTFVKHGAVGWNLVDEQGEPVPFDVNALLEDYTLAREVAEKADELYGESVMRPLLQRLRTTSQTGRTNGSTSATRRSTTKPRARSSRGTTAASARSMR
jgi:hypothetical protein